MPTASDSPHHRFPLPLLLFALLFLVAGPLHFVLTGTYARIMPPYLPHPIALIYISGVAEVLGGLGLLYPPTRRAAAWGLIALLIAVSPANIHMATAHVAFPGIAGESWAQWLRVPLQLPLMYWAWRYTRGPSECITQSEVLAL